MTALARTDEGQHLFSVLSDLGMSPREWRELDVRDRWFLMEAKSEANRRINRERQRQR
jgi:hypothetical protein